LLCHEDSTVSDRQERELEKLVAGGDYDAAERLYWMLLRSRSGAVLMDRLIEAAVRVELRASGVSGQDLDVSIQHKLAFVRGQPVGEVREEEAAQERAYWSIINVTSDLHRIPRVARQPGFTVYSREDRGVYRYQADGQWTRLVQLSAAPPGRPFYVVDTLSQRDNMEAESGSACLVLANRGVYKCSVHRDNPHASAATRHWDSVRFERRPG
jgi:hypothetical protein